MYRWMFNIHVYATLILGGFILLYFLTGFIMIFEEHFPRKNASEVKLEKILPGIQALSPDSASLTIRREFEVKGRMGMRTNKKNHVILSFNRPGTSSEAILVPGSDTVRVTIRKGNGYALMHHYHRLHGYQGGWKFAVWALMYDLSAFSMLAFAFSGIYLFYKTDRKSKWGWSIFIGFTLFTAFTVYYLMALS